MAWDTPGIVITLPASTGLVSGRFVTVNTSGKLAYPTAGSPILGVLCEAGTTGSTRATQVAAVQISGVAKVSAAASSMASGDLVAASSRGQVRTPQAGDYVVGQCVAGSSGAANRILSVAVLPIGTT